MEPCVPGPGQTVLFYGARYVLAVLHAAGSIVLVGSSTHHALQVRHYLRGRFGREKLEKLYAKVVAVAYVVTFCLGAALYPTYRVHVRGFYLDRYAPAVSALFDLKETYASLTLAVALALGALAFTLRPAEERALVRVYAVMSFLVCAVVWFNVVAGLVVASIRGNRVTAAAPAPAVAGEPSTAIRVFVTFLVARAVLGLVMLVTSVEGWPVLWYYPIEHRWAYETHPTGLAMGWYGATLLAAVSAAVLGGLTFAATSRRLLGGLLARASVARAVAHAGGLILLVDFIYFGWTLTHQTPRPLALPSWYCPR